MKPERYRVGINGIVQGVGFRPFVYKLAQVLSLKGIVQNTPEGVTIEIEGRPADMEAFVSRVVSEAPPLARIDSVQTEKLDYKGYPDFSILSSSSGTALNTLISPDIATCDDCSRELFDPADHRYHYPFINCTNCGPRYTIVCDVPYDRKNTTMKKFEMCSFCREQYTEPADRRYHAQPVCCGECGPALILLDSEGKAAIEPDGEEKPEDWDSAEKRKEYCANQAGIAAGYTDSIVRQAAEWIAAGKILAVKGLGGYHLVCNAADGDAVDELRRRKYRDEKPFALMARDMDTVKKYCEVDEEAARLLKSPERPIVLLHRKPGSPLPKQLAPGNPTLGIMLPYTPVHLLLFHAENSRKNAVCPEMLVMTSGNKSSEPISFEDEDALYRLGGIADYFLTNNRPIRTRTDDSVVRTFRGGNYFIRRSRGYAPAPITADRCILPENPPSVLALGGEMKNTFCLTKANHFFLSQHIGDLENMETLQAFEDGIGHYKKLFDIKPEIAAYDLHPAYLSTQYANTLENIIKVPVQHHHAHIASCMAENNLSGEVIGVAFDGTGYGEDGNIWGGEFFSGGYGHFKRAAHLEYFMLPGSEAAVKEPWRTAAACLYRSGYDLRSPEILSIYSGGIPAERLALVAEMLEKGLNSPATSSMGRLFDAVAALAGIRNISSFEGQAAMELEFAAENCENARAYDFEVTKPDGSYVIGIGGVVGGIMKDRADGRTAGFISTRFHETVACMVEDVCLKIRNECQLDRVVLSGGVFQNMRLLSACMDKLKKKSFQVFIHRRVPTNDGGISLGQAVIAMARCGNI